MNHGSRTRLAESSIVLRPGGPAGHTYTSIGHSRGGGEDLWIWDGTGVRVKRRRDNEGGHYASDMFRGESYAVFGRYVPADNTLTICASKPRSVTNAVLRALEKAFPRVVTAWLFSMVGHDSEAVGPGVEIAENANIVERIDAALEALETRRSGLPPDRGTPGA